MIGSTVQRLMELEIGGLCGAGQGEAARAGPINATALVTANGRPAGTVELRIPKLRRGSYFPALERRCMAEKALTPGSRRRYVRESRPARNRGEHRRVLPSLWLRWVGCLA
ncbi:MAG: transposase [Acidisphaera sp.]|nr:transposase [Acidisphaera sp.]